MNMLKLTEIRLKELVDHYNKLYPQDPITTEQMVLLLLVDAVYHEWVKMKKEYCIILTILTD